MNLYTEDSIRLDESNIVIIIPNEDTPEINFIAEPIGYGARMNIQYEKILNYPDFIVGEITRLPEPGSISLSIRPLNGHFEYNIKESNLRKL